MSSVGLLLRVCLFGRCFILVSGKTERRKHICQCICVSNYVQ